MKQKPSLFSLICLIAFVTPSFSLTAQTADTPPRVIIDTDIDSDVDDAGALAMLFNLHRRGAIQLTGIVVTSDDPYAVPCTSALCDYYGYKQMPIGFLKGQTALKNHSRYTRQISEEFPHTVPNHEAAPCGTQLYRKLLAESPDHSVIIVTIGHLTNLMNLMASPADALSPLTGKELIDRKVKIWYCMGGYFPEGEEANFVRPHPQSTVYCLAHWTQKVIFCGWETGNEIVTGGQTVKKTLSPSHPVYRAYELYNNFAGRASWDQLAVFLLLPDWKKYFDPIDDGKCVVTSTGANRWVTGPKENHSFICFKRNADKEQLTRQLEELMIEGGENGEWRIKNEE